MTGDSRTTDTAAGRLVLAGLVVIWLLFVGFGLALAALVEWPGRYDEQGHLSYAAEIAATGDWTPDLNRLTRIVALGESASKVPNYINHPPTYYLLVAGLIDRTGAVPADDLMRLRLATLAIGAAGLAVLMFAGLRAYGPTPAALLFGLLAAAVPQVQVIMAQVSNDALVLLGGSMALAGGLAVARTTDRASGWLLLAAGTVVAGATKLTAAILCLSFAGVLLLLLAHQGRTLPIRWLVVMGLAAALAGGPYVAMLLTYGSPAPNTLGQEMLLVEGARRMGWLDRERLDPIGFLLQFTTQFVWRLMPPNSLTDGVSVPPPGWYRLGLLPPLLLLATMAAGAVPALLGSSQVPASEAAVLRAALVAVVLTLAANIGFAYLRHVDYGWLNDAQPRYLLPLLGIVPVGAMRLVLMLQNARLRIATATMLVAAACWAQLHLVAVLGAQAPGG